MKIKNKELTKITVPAKDNALLIKLVEKVNSNKEIWTLWKVINVNAIERLYMSDHGPVHFQIVANLGLRIGRILSKNKVEFSVVKDFNLSNNHAEIIIFLASILHDVGMTVSREGHEEFSLFIANNLLRELLDFMPTEERTIVISEVLHAIISHRKNGQPLTIEAGIVRVADALDMTEGRSRVAYEGGSLNIHSISVAAIDKVSVSEGRKIPVAIEIKMNNSAGIFQVDDLFKSKIKGSGIEKYLAVRAHIDTENEKKLIKEFSV